MQAAQSLRDKISAGGFTANESRENAVLRRLLNKSRPKAPERQELLRVRKEVELVRFRVTILSQEKSRKIPETRKIFFYSLCDASSNIAPKPTDQSRSNLLSRVHLQIFLGGFFVFDQPSQLWVVLFKQLKFWL